MSQKRVFAIHKLNGTAEEQQDDHPKIHFRLLADDGKEFNYQFHRSIEDEEFTQYKNIDLHITVTELPSCIPTFVLICSEERNWFTHLVAKSPTLMFLWDEADVTYSYNWPSYSYKW